MTKASDRIALIILFAILCFTQSGCNNNPQAERTGGWSFVVYSDNRGSNPFHRTVLKSIAEMKPNLILNLGDLVFRTEKYGTLDSFKQDVEDNWGDFESFNKIFYPTIGGHEERYYNQQEYPPYGKEPDNEAGKRLYEELSLKERVAAYNGEYGDYYFKHKGVHFIIMYLSDEWKVKDGQVKWLEKILKKIKIGEPIVACGHDGGWFLPSKDKNSNHEKIRNLLRKHRVEIELAADFHDYYVNIDGTILQIRSGSVGWGHAVFIKFDVTDEGFEVTTFKPDGITPFTGKPGMHPRWIKKFGKPPIRKAEGERRKAEGF